MRSGVLMAVGFMLLGPVAVFSAPAASADETAGSPPAVADAQSALPGAQAAASPDAQAAASPDAAAEASSDWSYSFDASYYGKYVWRGINTVNGSVFQPSVTLGYQGFSLNIWGNMDISDVNGHSGQFTELDYTLGYGWDEGDFSFGLGAIYYAFPNVGAPDTTELYGSVTYNSLLSPTLAVYRDIDEADGTYVSLGASHSFEDVWQPRKDVSVGVDLSGSVGFGSANYNNFYFGVNHSALNNALLTVGVPVKIGDHWTVTPSLNYSALLTSAIRDSMQHDDNLWGGLTLSCSF